MHLQPFLASCVPAYPDVRYSSRQGSKTNGEQQSLHVREPEQGFEMGVILTIARTCLFTWSGTREPGMCVGEYPRFGTVGMRVEGEHGSVCAAGTKKVEVKVGYPQFHIANPPPICVRIYAAVFWAIHL